MPRFSANLGFLWSDRPLLDRIDAAAAAGFRACEFHWPYDVPAQDLAARCREHEIQVLGINTPMGNATRGERGLAALLGREAEFRAVFDQTLIYAKQIGASAIHVMVGKVAEHNRPTARAVLIDNLRAIAPSAAAHGITLLLEPLNLRDNPGYFYSAASEAASIIRELQIPSIKLQFDVYHVAIAEGDVLNKLELYRDMIGNVQIAAVPSRNEPDEGEIAYGAIFSALDRIEYRGWVGCEYKPRGDTDVGLSWVSRLGQSVIGVAHPRLTGTSKHETPIPSLAIAGEG
jgi:hydroxypyruvate isomerase